MSGWPAFKEQRQTLLVTEADGLLTVSLNRPDAAHARNQRMRDELADLWRAVAETDEIHAVVLTGVGDRFFCAGMDLREAAADESPLQRSDRMRRNRDIELLAALPQPTIAAVNGYALGGGLEMALACDIRIVAEEAQLGLPEVTRGLVPGGGGTQRLPRLIGYSRALELVVGGMRLTGRDAVAWGIASRCVPRAQVLNEALALAASFAAHPTKAVRLAKELTRHSFDLPLAEGIEAELEVLLALLTSSDGRLFEWINSSVDKSATRSI